MDIIHADLSYPLQFVNQNKVISNMNLDDQRIFDKKKTFDVVDRQLLFTIYSKIKSDDCLNNGGYFIVTTKMVNWFLIY